jgi:hypothetical protein
MQALGRTVVDRDTRFEEASQRQLVIEHVADGFGERRARSLIELYGLSSPPGARMAERVVFTGIALHADGSVDLQVDPIKIKLFAHDGEGDPEELYSETFFNLDLTAQQAVAAGGRASS